MKFGKVDIPDSVLWVAGLVLPAFGIVVYRHFHADPTDIVTDVQPSADPSKLTIVYSSGPSDLIAIPLLNNPALLKQALVGLTRDRIRTSLQGLPLNP